MIRLLALAAVAVAVAVAVKRKREKRPAVILLPPPDKVSEIENDQARA